MRTTRFMTLSAIRSPPYKPDGDILIGWLDNCPLKSNKQYAGFIHDENQLTNNKSFR